ncbi:hypothetical protein ACVW0Y_002313 [Pseudomonas sp. TE3786]
MYTLLEFKEQTRATYLNAALRQHGLDSDVVNIGVDPEGNAIFSIVCFRVSQLTLARHLIYNSRSFIGDIQPEVASELQEIRRQKRQALLGKLTSAPALLFAAVALIIAALGYLFDL